MTREEIIEMVKTAFDVWENEYDTGNDWSKEHKARDIVIKALEHPERNVVAIVPCGNAISRQAVLEAIDVKAWEFCDYLISKGRNDEQKPVSHFADNLRECIGEGLPPVNPQEPKTGHWEWVQYDYNPKLGNWHCSECRSVVIECVDKNDKGGIPLYKYCPQCGAKMQGVEE